MGGGINQRFRISMFLKGGPVAMSAYKATSLYIERLDDLCCHKAWKAGDSSDYRNCCCCRH